MQNSLLNEKVEFSYEELKQIEYALQERLEDWLKDIESFSGTHRLELDLNTAEMKLALSKVERAMRNIRRKIK